VHVVRKESPGEAPHSHDWWLGPAVHRLGIWGLRECRTEPKSTLPLCGAARELFRYATVNKKLSERLSPSPLRAALTLTVSVFGQERRLLGLFSGYLTGAVKSMCKVLVEMRGSASLTANACSSPRNGGRLSVSRAHRPKKPLGEVTQALLLLSLKSGGLPLDVPR
jgi:hypothetical protein